MTDTSTLPRQLTPSEVDAMVQARAVRLAAAAAAGVPHVGGDGQATGEIVAPPMGQNVAAYVAAQADVPVPDDEPVEPVGDGLPETCSEDEIPVLKARANKACGCDELRVIRVEGIEHDFIVRRPTRSEWDDYLNKATNASQAVDGEWNLCVECVVWPNLARMRHDRADLPAFPKRVCDALERFSGGVKSGRVVLVIDGSTTDEALSDPLGLTRADIEPLLRRFPRKPGKPATLRAVGVRTSIDAEDESDAEYETVIIKNLTAFQYDKLHTGFKSDDKSSALYDAAMSCIVWPSDEREKVDLLKATPGLPLAMFDVMNDACGASAKVVQKKL